MNRTVLVVMLAVVAGGTAAVWRLGYLHDARGGAEPADQPVTSGAPAAEPGAISATTPGEPAPAPAAPENPGGAANILAADAGGIVESITGEAGSGFNGRLLIDGDPDTVWTPAQKVPPPYEIVVSFYDREPAHITGVVVTHPSKPEIGAKEVEVWTSPDGSGDRFTHSASATLAVDKRDQVVSFATVQARRVKLRVLSGQQNGPIEIAGLQVLESRRDGYQSIAARRPDVQQWKQSPRQAAQLGIQWLQPATVEWQTRRRCFGCHVQAQMLMGLAIARRNAYIVSVPTIRKVADFIRSQQKEDGGFHSGNPVVNTQYGAMALAYADRVEGSGRDDAVFLKAVNALLERQRDDGQLRSDHHDRPIDQGSIMTTANSVLVFLDAFERTGDARYKAAADKGLAWIAAEQPESTQDKAFKILALTRHGTPEQRAAANRVVGILRTEQREQGGWAEHAKLEGPNAFATGQVLYAFKEAKVSTGSPSFVRGVRYLLETQKGDGSWSFVNTNSLRKSEFAPTMWAVIGLAGSFGETRLGELLVAAESDRPQKKRTRNLEVILDVSGSMRAKLGTSTRWDTARAVLQQVLDKLPDDFNVGLRVYGHRTSGAPSPRTCTDTDLLLPIAKLDRQRIKDRVAQLRPRGETPIVYSLMQTPGDLQRVGGGSVVLITDGEESCGGKPAEALEKLEAAGIDITVNIVGFTLKGKAVETFLTGLAEGTGGRYFSAQDGGSLARAVLMASIDKVPYTVFDASGVEVAWGEAGPESVELTPGTYRVVVHAGDQELTDDVVVSVGQPARLTLKMERDGFRLEKR